MTVANRDSAALKKQLLAAIPTLRAFATSLCGDRDQADDLVQQTLLKAWTHFDKFQEGTNLRAWLFTILRNTFISEVRRLRHHVGGRKILHELAAPGEQEGYLDMQDLKTALDQLPPEQREAVVLVGAAGVTYEETAAIVGCAVGTIKSRVHRARLKLGELMAVTSGNEFGPSSATAAIVERTQGMAGASIEATG